MSRREEIKRQITNHDRRLQFLKEKKAVYGLETPVSILTEIEDIEAEINELQVELERLENKNDGPGNNPVLEFASNHTRQLQIGVGIIAFITIASAIIFWTVKNHDVTENQLTNLKLVDVTVTEEPTEEDTSNLLLLDIKVRNTSEKVAFLKEAKFYIHDVVDMSPCEWWAPDTGGVVVSEVYNLELNHKKVPYTETIKISQEVPPNGVDRFQFRVVDAERALVMKGVTLYLVDLILVYNENNDELVKGDILLWPHHLFEPQILELPSNFSKPANDFFSTYLYRALFVGDREKILCYTTNPETEEVCFSRKPCVEKNIRELKDILEMSSIDYKRLDYLKNFVSEAEKSFETSNK